MSTHPTLLCEVGGTIAAPATSAPESAADTASNPVMQAMLNLQRGLRTSLPEALPQALLAVLAPRGCSCSTEYLLMALALHPQDACKQVNLAMNGAQSPKQFLAALLGLAPDATPHDLPLCMMEHLSVAMDHPQPRLAMLGLGSAQQVFVAAVALVLCTRLPDLRDANTAPNTMAGLNYFPQPHTLLAALLTPVVATTHD